jgi:hypothetical protein
VYSPEIFEHSCNWLWRCASSVQTCYFDATIKGTYQTRMHLLITKTIKTNQVESSACLDLHLVNSRMWEVLDKQLNTCIQMIYSEIIKLEGFITICIYKEDKYSC